MSVLSSLPQGSFTIDPSHSRVGFSARHAMVTKVRGAFNEYTGSATDPFGNARFGFEGAAEINRKDFGLTWNAALETGGILVSENIKLEFEISAIAAK